MNISGDETRFQHKLKKVVFDAPCYQDSEKNNGNRLENFNTKCSDLYISGDQKKKERLILEGRFDHFFGHGNVPVVIECMAIKTDSSKNKKRKIPTNPYPAMRIETAKYHEIETIFQKHHSICRHVLVSLLSGFEERGKKTQENVQHENIYPVIQLIHQKCAANTQNDPKN